MENNNYTINYKGDLRVEMTHLKSNTTIFSDAPVDNNGKGNAFSPTDLLASSLTSCMLTIMGIHFEKKGRKLTEISCEVKKVMTSNPRKIAEIHIEFDFLANTFDEADMRAIRHIIKTCPVSLSIHPELKVITNV